MARKNRKRTRKMKTRNVSSLRDVQKLVDMHVEKVNNKAGIVALYARPPPCRQCPQHPDEEG